MIEILLVLVLAAIIISKVTGKGSKWVSGPIGLTIYSILILLWGANRNSFLFLALGGILLLFAIISGFRQWSDKRALKRALGETR